MPMLADFPNKLRRRLAEVLDEFSVRLEALFRQRAAVQPYCGDPRIALLTVNFNTTAYLKLMLMTYADTASRPFVRKFVIVDNASKDGGLQFLRVLGSDSNILLIENAHPASHAEGLRRGIEALNQLERDIEPSLRTNLYLIVDTDILFLRSGLTELLAAAFNERKTGVAGEVQYDVGFPYVHPSCMMVAKACYDSPGVLPFINNGAPALHFQTSLLRSGFRQADIAVRKEAYVLHRGRGSIQSTRHLAPHHAYATVRDAPHYHGNPQGASLWAQVERKYTQYLADDSEERLLDYLKGRLSSIGNQP